MSFDYQKICLSLFKKISPRQKEVIVRRFGLEKGKRETLAAIGKDFGITRERVRQIEGAGLAKLKFFLKKDWPIFQYFEEFLKKSGGLKKESVLLEKLGGEKNSHYVYFLLNLGEQFRREKETKEFFSLWFIDQESLSLAKRVIKEFISQLKKRKKPLSIEDFSSSLPREVLLSYLEISREIEKNLEGLYGLKDWPEINPRGVRDKAYIVFQKVKKPLHFQEVATTIDSFFPSSQKKTNIQTVHNELIKDERFVLVGRGLYALKEWGYLEGDLKDVISQILQKKAQPLSKKEIIAEVLKQRLVKKSTILVNLQNKDYFARDSLGRYYLKTKLG